MKTKTVKRRKLNFTRILIVILCIYSVVCFGLYIYKEPVRHFEITGNSFVSDARILREAGLTNYPSYVSINPKKLAKKLESNPLIKKAKVVYGLYFYIHIEIEENKPLFLLKATNQVCLADGTLIDYQDDFIGLPTLLNDTPEKNRTLLAKNLSKVDPAILYAISEIEYRPSHNTQNKIIDENRFLLSMNDKNMVYITAKKATLLNSYFKVIATKQITVNGTFFFDGDENNHAFKIAKNETTTTEKTVE